VDPFSRDMTALLGRSDDMIIFRAVNIYPGQVDHMLSGMPGIGSEYQIILDRKEDGKDYMTVKVERDQGGDRAKDAELMKTIAGEIKKQILVSAAVEIVDYGALPRSERKSKRVFDNRDFRKAKHEIRSTKFETITNDQNSNDKNKRIFLV
jgi:phenylacetate-CoA ligase